MRILIDADVVAARRTARALSERLAFSPSQRLAWTGAVGVIAQEALHHAGGGEALFENMVQDGVRGIQVTIREHEPRPDPRTGAGKEARVELQRAVDALSVERDEDGRNTIRVLKWEDLAQRKLRERARDLI